MIKGGVARRQLNKKAVNWLTRTVVFLGMALTVLVGAESENLGDVNEPVANPDPPHLVWIQPGKFIMGSPLAEQDRSPNEGPATMAIISRGFWMSKYETTQQEYELVMGNNPSASAGDAMRPVERVSWDDATNYCCRLTIRERAAGRLPSGYAYRLPTEAEWEYCCRAGATTATAYGDSISSAQANFNGTSPLGATAVGLYLKNTTKVGSYAPNAWGLYDMHGNVWEWCSDWHGPYPGGTVSDPRGAITSRGRVLRGGSWFDRGGNCRSATRDFSRPYGKDSYVGFRPVLAPDK